MTLAGTLTLGQFLSKLKHTSTPTLTLPRPMRLQRQVPTSASAQTLKRSQQLVVGVNKPKLTHAETIASTVRGQVADEEGISEISRVLMRRRAVEVTAALEAIEFKRA